MRVKKGHKYPLVDISKYLKPPTRKETYRFGEPQITKLESGLTIITERLKTKENCKTMGYVGSGWLCDGKKFNLAHLVEHLVVPDEGEEAADALSKVDSYVNGEVNPHYTGFEISVRSPFMSLAVAILADVLFNPEINAEKFLNEQKVVLNENGRSMDSDTVEIYIETLLRNKVWNGHPYVRDLNEMGDITLADVKRFISCHYVPSNIVVSCAGRLSHEKVLRQLERAVSTIQKKEISKKEIGYAKYKPSVLSMKGKTELTYVIFAAEANPQDYTRGFFTTKVLSELLEKKLFSRIRINNGLDYDPNVNYNYESKGGLLFLNFAVSPKNVKQVIDLVKEELHKLRTLRNYFTQDEINSYRLGVLSSAFQGFDDPLIRAEHNGLISVYGKGFIPYDEFIRRFLEVDQGDLYEEVNKIFALNKLSLVVAGSRTPNEDVLKELLYK